MAQVSDTSNSGDGYRINDPVPATAVYAGAGTFVEHSAVSERGPARKTLEDTICHTIPDDPELLSQKGSLFVMADGVGGYGGGDIASMEAARVLGIHYYDHRGMPDRALKVAMGEANLHVFDLGVEMKHPNLSTTLSALAIVGSRFHIVHIGDTRIYRLREHTDIELLTEDHSEAADLVRMQIVRPENLRGHPRRHVITRSIGSEAVARPMAKSGNVQSGDYFVLCTDGLWEFMEDHEINEVVRFMPIDRACSELVNHVLQRSPTDNISVMIVHVLGVDEAPVKEQGPGGFYRAILRLFGTDE